MGKVEDLINIGKKLLEAKEYVSSSSLSEEYKKDLFNILDLIAENPGKIQTNFKQYLSSLVGNINSQSKEKIRANISLDEQKENLEYSFGLIQKTLPYLQVQLESMKGQGYFSVERTAQKKSPREGTIYGYLSLKRTHAYVYTKKEFTDGDIDELISKLENIGQETKAMLDYISNNKTIGVSDFEKNNFNTCKQKVILYIQNILYMYSTINYNFLDKEFPVKLLNKKIPVKNPLDIKPSSNYNKIEKRLGQRMIYGYTININGLPNSKSEKDLIFVLPEMGIIEQANHFFDNFGEKKEIDNPEYHKTAQGIETLKQIVDQLVHILSEKE